MGNSEGHLSGQNGASLPPNGDWRILWLIWRFVVEVAVGTFLFVLIAFVALGLSRFVDWLDSNGMPDLFLQAMKLLEYALFGVDVISFSVFLLKLLFEFIRELIWSRH
jgi:hypothetical protein